MEKVILLQNAECLHHTTGATFVTDKRSQISRRLDDMLSPW